MSGNLCRCGTYVNIVCHEARGAERVMKPFAYARPAEIAEAVRQVAAPTSSAFLAGGTNLLDHLKLGIAQPDLLVDIFDIRCGQVMNHDLAEYHIAANADVHNIECDWLDEHDPCVNAMGSKGIGEIGITGAAAAVVNAVARATGLRVRSLPVTLDKLLSGLPAA
jgi:hypothetical protein